MTRKRQRHRTGYRSEAGFVVFIIFYGTSNCRIIAFGTARGTKGVTPSPPVGAFLFLSRLGFIQHTHPQLVDPHRILFYSCFATGKDKKQRIFTLPGFANNNNKGPLCTTVLFCSFSIHSRSTPDAKTNMWGKSATLTPSDSGLYS